MTVHIVRLGTPRLPDEGTRIGTVRRPPRGVPKSEFARQNWYDVWFPNLAPSVETMKLGQEATTPAQWSALEAKLSQAVLFDDDELPDVPVLPSDVAAPLKGVLAAVMEAVLPSATAQPVEAAVAPDPAAVRVISVAAEPALKKRRRFA